MMAGSSDIEGIAQYLAQTLHPSTRKQAEANLAQLISKPQFAPILLELLSKHPDDNVKFSAAVYFKNFIKRKWKPDGDFDEISPQDREQIKQNIINIMTTAPNTIILQLSEAVTLIANTDFPDRWGSLLRDIIGKLSLQDLHVNIGLLQTVHSIFKRWRTAFEGNAVLTEIQFALTEFAPAYLEFFKAINALVDKNDANLPVLLETVFLLVKIFHSLNCQDLPEFFEDNMPEFMLYFKKYLEYQNPALPVDPYDAGILEKIKTAICEVIDMYANKYEAEFKQLPQFVEIIWTLLTSTNDEQRFDVLVSKAMSFLTAVVKHERHRSLFENENVLNSICTQIILPNMALRDSDVELFEDDPIEFIRRDLEGSDTETRRRASADLVRGLMTLFEKPVTELFSNHINTCLAEYQLNTSQNWKSKDTALFLITALCAKTMTASSGATSTNEYIPIMSVFSSHIIPDLQQQVDGALHPIIKVDAIKYLMIFRQQLTKEQILQVLPSVMNHLGSSNYVVNTWAAHCIERILSMKYPTGQQMFIGSDISAFVSGILTRLFDLIQMGKTPEKLAENDYLIKCVLRVVVTSRQDLLPQVSLVLERLSIIIREISKNPSNPKFNHYAFETLSAVVKYVCGQQPELVQNFENSLFVQFQEILAADVVEFTPYVFQILSQLLALHPDNQGIPQNYVAILPPLLQPAQWENFANIPALVNLLSAFLSKSSNTIIQNGQFTAFLGIFQKLAASRANDHHGLNFFKAIYEYVPTEVLSNYLKNLFVILMTRIFQSKTPKFTKYFLELMVFIILLDKPGMGIDDIIAVFDSIQPGYLLNSCSIFGGIVENILIPDFKTIQTDLDRKNTAIAMTKLLTSSQLMLTQYSQQWPKVLSAVMELFAVSLATNVTSEKDPIGELEDIGYQPSFIRLASSASKKAEMSLDPEVYLVQSLASAIQVNPQLESVIINTLAPETSASLLLRIKNSVQR